MRRISPRRPSERISLFIAFLVPFAPRFLQSLPVQTSTCDSQSRTFAKGFSLRDFFFLGMVSSASAPRRAKVNFVLLTRTRCRPT